MNAVTVSEMVFDYPEATQPKPSLKSLALPTPIALYHLQFGFLSDCLYTHLPHIMTKNLGLLHISAYHGMSCWAVAKSNFQEVQV